MAARDYPLASAAPAAEFIPTPNHVWAFDLGKASIGKASIGKASIGEAVRVGTDFKHKASLLIAAEFGETKAAARHRADAVK